MKTVCVLILGWLLFDSELTLKNILGMAVAVLGMVIYSWAVEADKQTNSMVIPPPKDDLEEDVELLKQQMDTPLKDVELGKSQA